jgi:hypothetical protein
MKVAEMCVRYIVYVIAICFCFLEFIFVLCLKFLMIVQSLMHLKKRKWMASMVKCESSMVTPVIIPFISLILFITPYNVDMNQTRITLFLLFSSRLQMRWDE